ncbi:MAG TPA: DUF5050 domain-containing protein, partial [Clostridiales bacterium]|nr:DUF5050 domain-containing protein [Clostridiales bacterium]
MFKDNIDLEVKGPSVRGFVTVEIKEEATGEVVFKETKENFISTLRDTRLKFEKIKETIGVNPPTNRIYSAYANAGNLLVLTSQTDIESPGNEASHKGALIGLAYQRAPYSGDSPFHGSFNQSESYIGAGESVQVYDFGTNACNGTFRSVGFTSSYFAGAPNNASALIREGVNALVQTPRVGVCISQSYDGGVFTATNRFCVKDGFAYICDNSAGKQIVKMDLATGESQVLFNQAVPYIAIDVVGDKIWCLQTSGNKIVEMNMDGAVQRTITHTITSPHSLSIEDDGIWIGSSYHITFPATGLIYNACVYKLGFDGTLTEFIEHGLYRLNNFTKRDGAFYFNGGPINTSGGHSIVKATYMDGVLVKDFPSSSSSSDGCYDIDVGDSNKGIYYTIGFDDHTSNLGLYKIQTGGLLSRVLLSSPQTKTNTQTMKVTYTITW